jgi:hypothetical protein
VKALFLWHLSLSGPGRRSTSVQDQRRELATDQDRDKLAAVAMTRSLTMAGYRSIERSGSLESMSPPGDVGVIISGGNP